MSDKSVTVDSAVGVVEDGTPVREAPSPGHPTFGRRRFVVGAAILVVTAVVVTAAVSIGPGRTRPHVKPPLKKVMTKGPELAAAAHTRLAKDGLSGAFTVTCPSVPVIVGGKLTCQVTSNGQTGIVLAEINAQGGTSSHFSAGPGLYVVPSVIPEATAQVNSSLQHKGALVGACTRSGVFVNSATDAEIMRCNYTPSGGVLQKNGVAIEQFPTAYIPPYGWAVVPAAQADIVQRNRVVKASITAAAPALGHPGADLTDASAATAQLLLIAQKFATSQVDSFGIPVAWVAAQPGWPQTMSSQPSGAGISYGMGQIVQTAAGSSAIAYQFSFAVRDTAGRCFGAVLAGTSAPTTTVMPPTQLDTCSASGAFTMSGLVAYMPTATPAGSASAPIKK